MVNYLFSRISSYKRSKYGYIKTNPELRTKSVTRERESVLAIKRYETSEETQTNHSDRCKTPEVYIFVQHVSMNWFVYPRTRQIECNSVLLLLHRMRL